MKTHPLAIGLVVLTLCSFAAGQFACSDCNLNGTTPEILDALVAAQLAAGLGTPSLDQNCACDIDSDGAITVLDALGTAQYSAGLPTVPMCPLPTCGNLPPTVAITAPMGGTMFGSITVTLDADDPDLDPLDLTFEFSTDAGVTFALASTAGAGSIATNPALMTTVPVAAGTFVWTSDVDMVGLMGLQTVDFRVSATDNIHPTVATSSTTFDVDVPAIALVSETNGLDEPAIATLLAGAGYTTTIHNNNGATGIFTSDPLFLAAQRIIVLHQTNRALTAAEGTALQAFLDGGGRLLVTGYDSLGSPTDPILAGVVNSTAPGDGPFSSVLSVTNDTHPIMMGPAQAFTLGMALTASSTDHDQCTPGPGAISLMTVAGSSTKLLITDMVGPGNGKVCYWNGNGSFGGALTDWNGGGGTQPDLQNLFLNVLDFLNL